MQWRSICKSSRLILSPIVHMQFMHVRNSCRSRTADLFGIETGSLLRWRSANLGSTRVAFRCGWLGMHFTASFCFWNWHGCLHGLRENIGLACWRIDWSIDWSAISVVCRFVGFSASTCILGSWWSLLLSSSDLVVACGSVYLYTYLVLFIFRYTTFFIFSILSCYAYPSCDGHQTLDKWNGFNRAWLYFHLQGNY